MILSSRLSSQLEEIFNLYETWNKTIIIKHQDKRKIIPIETSNLQIVISPLQRKITNCERN